MPRLPSELPGPRGLPIVGNAMQFDLEGFHLALEKWVDEFGSPFRIQLGPKQAVVTSNHEEIRNLLRARPDGFRRPRNMQRVFQETRVHGVFSAEGEDWRRQRKLMLHAFSPRQLSAMFEPVRTSLGRIDALWDRAADESRSVDALDHFRRFAVDVATTVAFGIDVNTLEQGPDELRQYLEHVLPVVNRRVMSSIPYWRWFRLPSDRLFDRSVDALRGKVAEMIADARARLEAEPERIENPRDLIEAMLVARDEDGEAARLDDQEIFANAMTVLIAGEDTTSNTAAWMFDHLARAPGLQQRLREELHAQLGPGTLPSDPRDLRKLPFLDAVVQETLRLRSAAPIMFYESIGEREVDGVRVDPRDLVITLTRKSVMEDARYADGATFDPTRWLDAERDPAKAHDAAGQLAFGYGPRICPGRSLALLELSLLGAGLVSRYELTPGGATPPRELFIFTMSPSGVKLKLRRVARVT